VRKASVVRRDQEIVRVVGGERAGEEQGVQLKGKRSEGDKGNWGNFCAERAGGPQTKEPWGGRKR